MRAIKTVIPYKSDNPKSRLSPVLTEEERKIFSRLSLKNVLTALKESEIPKAEILSKNALTADEKRYILSETNSDFEIKIKFDDRDLNTAVNAYLKELKEPVLIVMADLALLKKENVVDMIKEWESELNFKELVKIAPGKDGGTNMMYIGSPDIFEVSYYGNSFEKHREEAKRKRFECKIYNSLEAAADMDEPEDLEEIIKYGFGEIFDFINQILTHK
ncbi:MAG: 2-phospho-L-lactate guanylyltransferase [Methanimicrococcus sp.]|nr:2-phospho-L-lactate guanylyltransferase [Methanimicrococcus sp.]